MAQPHTLVAISTDGLSAEINPVGAELHSLKDRDGADLQWNGDPAVWTGRAPILFPIVGMLVNGRYRLDDNTYALPKHGFARHKLFEVASATTSSATFRLKPDAETLAAYPFQFELDVEFALLDFTLSLTAVVKNRGDEPMPASFGFHPALRWPLPYGQPRAAHMIRFEHSEPEPIRRIDQEGVVKPQVYPTPVEGHELTLHDDLFVDDALIFDRIASRSARYGAANGPHLEVAFPNTPYLGVWTKPGAGFICVEPWHGMADPAGFQGQFRDKPGVFEVSPKGEHRLAMSISLKA